MAFVVIFVWRWVLGGREAMRPFPSWAGKREQRLGEANMRGASEDPVGGLLGLWGSGKQVINNKYYTLIFLRSLQRKAHTRQPSLTLRHPFQRDNKTRESYRVLCAL